MECNQIALKNRNEEIIYSIQENCQPKTSIYNYYNGEITQYKIKEPILYDIEFIMIRENIDIMTHPNSNNVYSYIGRFGLPLNRSGLFYKFMYLMNFNNHDENLKNNDIKNRFEIKDVISNENAYKLKILPEFFPNGRCLFDFNEKDGKSIYKKVFMLRFFEKVINNMQLVEYNNVPNMINDLQEIIKNCNEDIYNLLNHYDEIKCKTIELKDALMKGRYENVIDIDKCYKDFVDQLEKVLNMIDKNNFRNSFTCWINGSDIIGKKDFADNIEKLLKLADSEDVCKEFVPRNIDISIENLSDGIKYLLSLYSAIHKCFKHNEINKYKTIVLILDEPDVHMHPEWSRKLINSILKFLKQEFPCNKFQIIFSTHSPFILSDIIKEDVIYFHKNNEGQSIVKNCNLNTFGANIHTLLKDSFFMDSTIGEFAKIQINEIIAFLLNDDYRGDMNKEKAKYIIYNIGEGLIRKKILKMYFDKYPEEIEDANDQIKYYQNEVAYLQKIIDSGMIIDRTRLSNFQSELENTLKVVAKLINSNGERND